MKKYACPSCGADVVFQSSASVFSVCQYCRSTLVRNDVNIEAIGKMADLQDDATPLQLGTSGRFKGDFLLIGRVRVAWSDGFWNEWFVRYDDGREAWLGEAQGFYMLSVPVTPPPASHTLPTASQITPEMNVKIGPNTYAVDDIKQVTYSFAEGELPFMAPQGFKGVSVDLRNGEDDFASISYDAEGDIDVFVGQYLEFDKFHFQNLRQIDGW